MIFHERATPFTVVVLSALSHRAVVVAVDTGRSARVVSFMLLLSEASAMIIISAPSGVTPVVSVGNKIFDIVFLD